MKTWLITGCTSGIGHQIAKIVLEKGDNAIITARKGRLDKLNELLEKYPNQTLAVELELTDNQMIKEAVKQGIEYFGQIDVLVNNAGRGYTGTIEETDIMMAKELFETNFFGPINVIKEVLPDMRKRRSGAIINISSLGVLTCGAGSGYYVASKSALEKISTVLRKEVEPFGIKVMVVEPGPFRTQFRVSHLPSEDTKIDDYKFVQETLDKISTNPYGQTGDPNKAAKVIVSMIEQNNYPKMIILGKGKTDLGIEIINEDIKEIYKWKEIGDSTDFII